MRRINYRSDFRFALSLKNGNVDLSQSPYWKAVLTTTGTNSYEVSRNGDEFKNCEIDELGKLQVIVDNHKLEVGELSIEVTLFIPSTDYSDGIELDPVREKTGIMLVPDGGDAPSELDVQVLLPYVYIDAYEIAKRYGYEGTAEDYIDILKNLGLYAKKTEVYEVAGKVDKIGDTVETLEGEVSAVSGEVGMLSTRLSALNKSVGDLVESDVTINAKVNALTGVVEGKQDKISDLKTIREGASKGVSALQPDGACDGLRIVADLPEPSVMVYGGDGWESQRLQGNGALLTQGLVDMDYTLDGVMNEVGGLLESNTRLNDKVSALDTLPDVVSELGTKVEGKQDKISDLETIREGASKGVSALQSDGACDGLKIMGQLPEPSVMVYGGDGWVSERLQGMGSSLTQGLVDMDYTIDGIINELDNKQGVLESGVNVKTINGESILGAGNIVVQGGGNINVEGYPNVDELEEVKELSGNENIIITDSEGNKKTTIGNLKEYVVKDISELPPFRIFETESDYNAVKDELGDCVVCLRDTGVMLYHVYNKTEEGGGEIEDKYIRFADPEVQRILVENFSADGVGMTSEDIAKVTSIDTVFNRSTTITHFDEFSKFSNVTTLSGSNNATNAAFSGAFYGCSSLKTIKFPDSLLTIKGGAFVDTSALEIDLKIPSLTTVGNNIFKNSGIKRVLNLGNVANLGTSGTTNWGGEGFFFGCNKMEIAILPTTLSSIPPVAFYGCTALMALVFKSDVPPSLANTNAFTNTNNCPIYVPDASVEAYKGATNWSSFASRIKGISELPTDNAELYEEIKDYIS